MSSKGFYLAVRVAKNQQWDWENLTLYAASHVKLILKQHTDRFVTGMALAT